MPATARRAAASCSRSRRAAPKNDALRELDRAKEDRTADFAVLVVPNESKVPARMQQLREYNGDKLIVSFDVVSGAPWGSFAYRLARARVLMSKTDAEGIDASAFATASSGR